MHRFIYEHLFQHNLQETKNYIKIYQHSNQMYVTGCIKSKTGSGGNMVEFRN